MNTGECCTCLVEKNRILICKKCNKVNCIDCLLSYKKPFCMSCNYQFTQHQILQILNKKEIELSSLAQYWKDIYIKREEQKITNTIEYLKYLDQYNDYVNKIRFNRYKTDKVVISKPDINEYTFNKNIDTLKCSKEKCNGFIINYACNICGILYCDNCNEPTKENHKCDEEILKSIKLNKETSKPCPNCNILIFKTYGCDNMRCTNCGTYFCYNTLKINTKTSTSPIKDDELINNINKTDSVLMTTNINSIYIPELLVKTGHTLIDDDPYIIISFIKSKFNYSKIIEKYNKDLLNLRISIINKKIDRNKWINKIYNIEFKYNYDISVTSILYNYVLYIIRFINFCNIQISEHFTSSTSSSTLSFYSQYIDDKIVELIMFLDELNHKLIQLSNDYGGNIVKFKTDNSKISPLTF